MMSDVRRVYVEKKADFAVQAKELSHEIRHYLGIRSVTGVRVLIVMTWKTFPTEPSRRLAGACSRSRR